MADPRVVGVIHPALTVGAILLPGNRELFAHLFFLDQLQLWLEAVVVEGRQGHKQLSQVYEGRNVAEGDHEQEELPLEAPELTDHRQQVVEIDVIGRLPGASRERGVLLCPFPGPGSGA